MNKAPVTTCPNFNLHNAVRSCESTCTLAEEALLSSALTSNSATRSLEDRHDTKRACEEDRHVPARRHVHDTKRACEEATKHGLRYPFPLEPFNQRAQDRESNALYRESNAL